MQNFDPEEAFGQFFSFIDETYEKCFPEKIVLPRRVNKSKSPWMTQAIFESRKRKQKLFKKKIKKPSHENIQNLKEYNSIYTKLVRKARHEYYNDKF